MNYSWGNNRRFNSYSDFIKKEFGSRIQKVAINAGFTCPNRDGFLSYGGCTYCLNEAFNPSYCQPDKPIRQQVKEGIEFHEKRYRRANKYLAYFQAFSNTYAPIEKIKNIFNETLSIDKVAGLVIGTRPDCVDEEKLDYFQELSEKYYIIIEYGVESCYDKTLKIINRGHSFADSVETIKKTAKRNIQTGVHIILGLPGESVEEIINEADIISGLEINNLKLHQLQIIKNTPMEKDYINNPEKYNLFSLNEYIELIVKFVEKLNPEIMIERIAGEVPPGYLVAPDWGLIRNYSILRLFENKMKEWDTWQGKLYNA